MITRGARWIPAVRTASDLRIDGGPAPAPDARTMRVLWDALGPRNDAWTALTVRSGTALCCLWPLFWSLHLWPKWTIKNINRLPVVAGAFAGIGRPAGAAACAGTPKKSGDRLAVVTSPPCVKAVPSAAITVVVGTTTTSRKAAPMPRRTHRAPRPVSRPVKTPSTPKPQRCLCCQEVKCYCAETPDCKRCWKCREHCICRIF